MIQITEQCTCNASFSIAMDRPTDDPMAVVVKWRTSHLCPARHELSQKLGYDLFSTQKDGEDK